MQDLTPCYAKRHAHTIWVQHRTKGSGLAIMHFTPNLLKGIPTRFGFNIVFLLLFSQQKWPLPHVLRAQAAPVFVALSRFPSVHHSRKLSFPTCCTGPSKNSAIRRCLVLISQSLPNSDYRTCDNGCLFIANSIQKLDRER